MSCRTGLLRSATPQTRTCLRGPRFSGHFVACIPVLAWREAWGLALLGVLADVGWSVVASFNLTLKSILRRPRKTVRVTSSPARCEFIAAARSCGFRNLLAVHSDDEVAAQHDGHVALIGALRSTLQSGFFCGAAGQHALDQDAVVGGQADLFGDVGTNREGDDVERRPADAAIFCEVGETALAVLIGIAKPMPEL